MSVGKNWAEMGEVLDVDETLNTIVLSQKSSGDPGSGNSRPQSAMINFHFSDAGEDFVDDYDDYDDYDGVQEGLGVGSSAEQTCRTSDHIANTNTNTNTNTNELNKGAKVYSVD